MSRVWGRHSPTSFPRGAKLQNCGFWHRGDVYKRQEVVLTSVDGERRMRVDDDISATKKTALREDEIITKVIIPKQDFTHTFCRKIGMRRANAISKLTLSAAATVRDGVVVDFRASSGAAGPKVEMCIRDRSATATPSAPGRRCRTGRSRRRPPVLWRRSRR